MFGLGEDKIVNGYRIRWVPSGKSGAYYGVDSSGNINFSENVDPNTGMPYTGQQKDRTNVAVLTMLAIGLAVIVWVAKNANK